VLSSQVPETRDPAGKQSDADCGRKASDDAAVLRDRQRFDSSSQADNRLILLTNEVMTFVDEQSQTLG
jgi:hypothetical protein